MGTRFLVAVLGLALVAAIYANAQEKSAAGKKDPQATKGKADKADSKFDLPEPKRGASRWGKDDQRGAFNLVTPAKTLEAVQLIKTGKIYSLGRLYEEGMPMANGRQYSLIIPQAAPPLGENRIVGHEEYVAAQIGQVGTNVDGLGHVGIGNIFYNGYDRREFVQPKGLKSLGIENAGPIVTRGVLIDVAASKHVDSLNESYEITRDDLMRALESEGLELRPGDVVLIHTGWGQFWQKDNDKYSARDPGIGLDAGKFLVEQQVCLVGADNWAVEVVPNPDARLAYPVHQVLITTNGIYILENIDTSELARDKAYEFAFILSPLRLKGATGSPANPLAIR